MEHAMIARKIADEVESHVTPAAYAGRSARQGDLVLVRTGPAADDIGTGSGDGFGGGNGDGNGCEMNP